MSKPDSTEPNYGILYETALQELNNLYPELSESFLNEINSEGYMSPLELSDEERLFRLLLFFEYYLIKISIFRELKNKVNQLNYNLIDGPIKDVRFVYASSGQGELGSNLIELSRIFDNLNYNSMTNEFQSILGSFMLKDKYESYKIISASKIGSGPTKFGLR